MVQPQVADRAREVLAQFSAASSTLLDAVHALQREFGYVPKDAIPALSRHYGRSPADLYAVLTFYAEIRLEPPAEVTIGWCSGPACRLKGGDNIRRAMEAILGLQMDAKSPRDKVGEQSPNKTTDGRVGLHWAQCNGTCDLAPMVWVNGRNVGPLTVSGAIRLARELKAGKGAP